MRILFLFLLIIISVDLFAQKIGLITGRVLDRNSQNPIPFCTVILKGDSVFILESDSLGFFEKSGILIGGYTLEIHSEGYKSFKGNVFIESSITTKLTVMLEDDITQLKDVVIYSDQNNPFKLTSSYQFDSKDFTKSSTNYGDPSRIVQTLPGVVATNDGSNQIAVRGNSPFNNNWYIEGIEVPNPNHFASFGGSGGFIGVFNENTIEKFDFYLGGYPSMYGNSNSGVFDLKLRTGNTQKREQNFRLSPLGIYAGAEGYLNKKSRSSYILNGRIFDLYFFKKWGMIPTKNINIPSFKDFSYKICIPNKNDKLEISIFGFGGTSTLNVYSVANSITNSRMMSNNLSINYRISTKTRFNSTFQISKSLFENKASYPTIDTNSLSELVYRNHTYIQKKLNKKLNIRFGCMFSMKDLKNIYFTRIFDTLTGSISNTYQKDFINRAFATEIYLSSNYRLSERTKIILGVHSSNISFNNRILVEPRIGLTSNFTKVYEYVFSAGIYSKAPNYFVYQNSGKSIPYIQSLHLINSHKLKIDTSTTIKVELFYQYLWNVYLLKNTTATNATLLNFSEYNNNYYLYQVGKLSRGANFGIDFFLTKTFCKKIDMVLAGALYRSIYQDADLKWRNTAFDNKFTTSLQLSKNISVKKTYGFKYITFSTKVLYFGGLYSIPINYTESTNFGRTVYNNDYIFSQKLPNYFRLDVGCQITYSRERFKHELRFDVQNTTNRKNISDYYYDPSDKKVKINYQLPIIPVISYSIYF